MAIKKYTGQDAFPDFEESLRSEVFINHSGRLSQRQRTMIREYFLDRLHRRIKKGMPLAYFTDMAKTVGMKGYTKEYLVQTLDMNSSKPTIVIMAHVFSDAPHSFRWLLHNDYYEWLEDTLSEIASISNVNWLLKLHPESPFYHETHGAAEEMIQCALSKIQHLFLAPREMLAAGVLEIADGIVTAQGSAGLEFTLFSIPVLCCGDSYYSAGDFVTNARTLTEYHQLLQTFFLEPVTEHQMKRAELVAFLVTFCLKVQSIFVPITEYHWFMKYNALQMFQEALDGVNKGVMPKDDPLYLAMTRMLDDGYPQLMNVQILASSANGIR